LLRREWTRGRDEIRVSMRVCSFSVLVGVEKLGFVRWSSWRTVVVVDCWAEGEEEG